MKKSVLASVLTGASAVLASTPALWALAAPAAGQAAASPSGQITIKDPAEYNAYTAAMGQSDPRAKAAAIESFLQQYPNSVVKGDMLEQLLAAYQASQQSDKMLDTAKRVLQVNPSSLRALFIVTYLDNAQAMATPPPANQQALLDEAAENAQRALGVSKDPSLSDADFQKLKTATTPTFDSAIAQDALVKKDYKTAIAQFRAELQAASPEDTKKPGPLLYDTYQLGNAYLQLQPKDMLNAVWFLARAANFFPDPQKTQIDQAAQYWYKKYHGGPDGYDQVKSQAASSVFPPEGFTVTAAPPPPSPADQAHQAVASTTDLKTLALADKEFILANGSPEDAEKVWAVLKDQTTKVPGTVLDGSTPDSLKLAVTDDAKQSKTADFTINMKTPLKTVPAVGTDIEVIGTYDSYTQKPPQIILKDGELPAARPAARRSAPAHRRAQ
jgi:hypothetical protein